MKWISFKEKTPTEGGYFIKSGNIKSHVLINQAAIDNGYWATTDYKWLDESSGDQNLSLHSSVAKKLLNIKEALIKKDYSEAYHQLYSIADPDFTNLEPWKKLENIANGVNESWPISNKQTS